MGLEGWPLAVDTPGARQEACGGVAMSWMKWLGCWLRRGPGGTRPWGYGT